MRRRSCSPIGARMQHAWTLSQSEGTEGGAKVTRRRRFTGIWHLLHTCVVCRVIMADARVRRVKRGARCVKVYMGRQV